jgi:hypothetical protein
MSQNYNPDDFYDDEVEDEYDNPPTQQPTKTKKPPQYTPGTYGAHILPPGVRHTTGRLQGQGQGQGQGQKQGQQFPGTPKGTNQVPRRSQVLPPNMPPFNGQAGQQFLMPKQKAGNTPLGKGLGGTVFPKAPARQAATINPFKHRLVQVAGVGLILFFVFVVWSNYNTGPKPAQTTLSVTPILSCSTQFLWCPQTNALYTALVRAEASASFPAVGAVDCVDIPKADQIAIENCVLEEAIHWVKNEVTTPKVVDPVTPNLCTSLAAYRLGTCTFLMALIANIDQVPNYTVPAAPANPDATAYMIWAYAVSTQFLTSQ